MKKRWFWILLIIIISVVMFCKMTSKPIDILLYPAEQIESIDIIEVSQSEYSTMDQKTISSILYSKQEIATIDPNMFSDVFNLLSSLPRGKVFNDPPYSTIGKFFRIKYANGDYSLIGSDCMIVCRGEDGYLLSFRNNYYKDLSFDYLLDLFIKRA